MCDEQLCVTKHNKQDIKHCRKLQVRKTTKLYCHAKSCNQIKHQNIEINKKTACAALGSCLCTWKAKSKDSHFCFALPVKMRKATELPSARIAKKLQGWVKGKEKKFIARHPDYKEPRCGLRPSWKLHGSSPYALVIALLGMIYKKKHEWILKHLLLTVNPSIRPVTATSHFVALVLDRMLILQNTGTTLWRITCCWYQDLQGNASKKSTACENTKKVCAVAFLRLLAHTN